MKAIAQTRYLPIPDPQSLVDTKVCAPKDKVEESPRMLGWDASGVVQAVGPEVTLFQPGDKVYYVGDITRPGSNAEFQPVDARLIGHKPKTLSFAEAAAWARSASSSPSARG